jgi:hypothetical protein
LDDIFADRLQPWSQEKHEVLHRVFASLEEHLSQWGLRLSTREASLARRFPKNLYEISLQFAEAERLILEDLKNDRQSEIEKTIKLTADHFMTIQAVAQQGGWGKGTGLFFVIRDGRKGLRRDILNWLQTQGLVNAANFIKDLYFEKELEDGVAPTEIIKISKQDIQLSEQVLIAAFKNPVLGLGEWLEHE